MRMQKEMRVGNELKAPKQNSQSQQNNKQSEEGRK